MLDKADIVINSIFIMTKFFDKEAFLKEFHAVTQPAEHPEKPAARLFDGKVILEILDNRRPLQKHQVEITTIKSLRKGEGHAGKAMQFFTTLADKYNIGVVVYAAPSDREEGSLSRHQLFKFYKSHGFSGISSCPEMYRPSSMDRDEVQSSLSAAISP